MTESSSDQDVDELRVLLLKKKRENEIRTSQLTQVKNTSFLNKFEYL